MPERGSRIGKVGGPPSFRGNASRGAERLQSPPRTPLVAILTIAIVLPVTVVLMGIGLAWLLAS